MAGPHRGFHLQQCALELETALKIEFSVNLIPAAKRQLSFLRAVHCVPGLHHGPAVLLAIRRYKECWMPLVADYVRKVGLAAYSDDNALLPPFDVQWVWHCHCLSPMEYRDFCISKCSEVIDFPLLANAPSESAARERCRKLWLSQYPKEPFDILPQMRKLAFGRVFPINEQNDDEAEDDLVAAIFRQSSFYLQMLQPYMWKETFLDAAQQRYKCFLHMVRKSKGKILCVPTSDINLMWHSHQLSPVAYARDTEALLGCVIDHDDTMQRGPNTKLDQGFEDTTRLWEKTFGQPYEKAGSMFQGTQPLSPTPIAPEEAGFERVPVALPWDYHPRNINKNLTHLTPRFVVEGCVCAQSASNVFPIDGITTPFVRLRALAAHKLMKLDTSSFPYSQNLQWQRLWLFQCEVSMTGIVLELRCHSTGCLKTFARTKLLGDLVFTWKELQESPMLSIDHFLTFKEKRILTPLDSEISALGTWLRIEASITPSVPAPYLFKTVPDRVTDDTGAMISGAILKLKKNEPQQGRWISRTVLDHSGKECFVIRIRAARGIWSKSTHHRPIGVDWNERVIHICAGGWNYISGSIGVTPDNIVASAVPFSDELERYRMSWSFSSGETLTISRHMDNISWERDLNLSLHSTDHGLARLLNGRKFAYKVPGSSPLDEEGFVTVVRYTADAPHGKATALYNWKASIMEVHPEENVLLVLLLCTATLRSVADLGGGNYGNLVERKRAQEPKPGLKDWGSFVLENPESQPDLSLWYVNSPRILATADEGKERNSSTSLRSRGSSGIGDWSRGTDFVQRSGGFGGGVGGIDQRRTGSGIQL